MAETLEEQREALAAAFDQSIDPLNLYIREVLQMSALTDSTRSLYSLVSRQWNVRSGVVPEK